MTASGYFVRCSQQFARLAAMVFFTALCAIAAAAQSVDRAQLLREIMGLQNQLRAATDPVQIATLEGQLKAKEAIFLQPDAADFTANAAFLAQPGTGLIRILPRESFDGLLQTRGGGAYYSFVRLVHEYGYGSDLELQQSRFSVGFAGADFGFLVSLGSTDLNSVTVDHPGVRYLVSFTPPLSETEARQQQQRASQGFTENGFSYRNNLPATLGETYAVRSVGYRTSDVLIAFRFVRADDDGSQILQWKLLRWFPAPQLNGGSIASVSAASYKRGVFARDSIVALFGNGLSPTTEVTNTLPLPTVLAGVRVSVSGPRGGGAGRLFAVTPNQVNFQIPSNVANGWAFLDISRADGTRYSEIIRVEPVSPGVFTANADGNGVPAAVALRLDTNGGQIYSPVARFDGTRFVPIPIELGPEFSTSTFLVFYGTGIRGHGDLSNVKVSIGGVNVPVSYAGAADGFAGLDQVNAQILPGLAGRGEVHVVLTANGQIANTVRINIK